MAIPGGYMGILSAGPTQAPYALHGSIGTGFLTPQQSAFKATRKMYGTLDDPDAGGYQLSQIWWDKDNGDAEINPLEATYGGWYSDSPRPNCNCPPQSGRACTCQ